MKVRVLERIDSDNELLGVTTENGFKKEDVVTFDIVLFLLEKRILNKEEAFSAEVETEDLDNKLGRVVFRIETADGRREAVIAILTELE